MKRNAEDNFDESTCFNEPYGAVAKGLYSSGVLSLRLTPLQLHLVYHRPQMKSEKVLSETTNAVTLVTSGNPSSERL
jgi:hypothetical protein